MTAESSWAGGRSESWKERVPNLDPAILKLRAPSDVLTTRTERLVLDKLRERVE